MRKIWLLCLVTALSAAGFAQGPPTGGGGGARRGGGQIPAIGHFYGKVVDAKTNKGMDGASVQLIQTKYDPATHAQKDTVVSGEITGRKGDFSMENLPILGNFRLKITAIGYTTYEQKVTFDLKGLRGAGGTPGAAGGDNGDQQQGQARALAALNAVDKDLGNIKLNQDAQSLEQVTVTASKPLIQMGVDRKIYNVEKDIAAQGGSATDVMKNVPSVQVDIDGNVTLRNSTPTIFVDGRPTTLTLDQIPADAIQSVEIITNPGAKYDASGGTSGILNIVLKKNRKAGYNGNVRAGIDQRGKFNGGGDFNLKQGKVNFFASGNYQERKSISPGNITRYTFDQPGYPNDSLFEHDNSVNKGYFAFGRVGLDYLIDNRNTLTIAGNIVHGTFTPYTNSDIYVDTLYTGGTTYSYTRRLSNTTSDFNNHGALLSFKHTFPKSGEEWTADANYSQGTNNNNNPITSNIYDIKGGALSSVYDQLQVGNGTNKYFTAQTDYVLPFGEKGKFEAGVRGAFRNIYNLSDIDTLNAQDEFSVEGLLSSEYTYRDQVLAAYSTYSNAISNFTYQLGLRVESSSYHGVQNYTADSLDNNNVSVQYPTVGHFSNKYPLSFFPSVFLTQKLTDNQDLQINYTRRIDRPSFQQLFPFTDYSDSLNLSRGNPNLKPQFTNSFELTYSLTYAGNANFLASAYYKNTTDLITRLASEGTNPVNDRPVIINTYINAESSFVGGLEFISRNSINRWWDVTGNVNLFISKINTIDTGQFAVPPIGRQYSAYLKAFNTFKLTKSISFQLSGDFTTKTVLPPGGSSSNGGNSGRGFGGTVSGNANGYNRPTGGMDAAIRFEFMKNKAAALTLSCSDILRTRVSDVYTYSSTYTQEYDRRRDPQFFRLQFNWRFGKFDMNLFKRKNTKGDQENIQQGMQGGGGAGPAS